MNQMRAALEIHGVESVTGIGRIEVTRYLCLSCRRFFRAPELFDSHECGRFHSVVSPPPRTVPGPLPIYEPEPGPRPNLAGENNPNAKLSKEAVGQIRQQYEDGVSALAIANEFGVTPQQIRNVAHGRCWRPVTDE